MLSHIADIADLIAAAAIIVSLLFVAYEVRLNRKQAELTNWRETLVMMVEFKSRTNDQAFAEFMLADEETRWRALWEAAGQPKPY